MVFVDTRVDGYEQFLEDFISQTSGERRIEVRLLDTERDGIEQISQALAGYSDLDAVHFLSHGTDGAVQLGATWLDRNSLQAMAGSIAQWRASLSADADLLFYGCDLAASPVGIAFVEQLSLLTGADVAASVDRTGQRHPWRRLGSGICHRHRRYRCRGSAWRTTKLDLDSRHAR